MGRPRKTIDEAKLRSLALIGCSLEAMARALGVNRHTLERRYRDQIEEARGDAESRIPAKTFQLAVGGNVRCLELSLVNRCGWSLRPETVINVTQNAGQQPAMPSPAEIRARLIAASEFTTKFLAEHGDGERPIDGNGR